MPDEADLVDRDRLRAFLAERLGETDTFDVERHDQGFSNETLFVTWGDRELVIRRPPPGETADTAHDVLREYEVVHALQDTDVPVPTTVAESEDTDVMGCPFYVMERLDGDVMRFVELDRFSDADSRRQVGEEMVDTLAAIHTVDVETVGLGDFGTPEGFAQRQVDRWTEQFEWAFEETTDEREVTEIHRIGDWLDDNVPEESAHALVHGDYKLDNVIFTPGSPPEIGGVLDWEMSTLGDPLCDLGWLLFFWPDPEDDLSPLMQTMAPSFTADEDYLTRGELVERYEDQTGVTVENQRFYRVLAVYKMAALGEMFFARYLMGNSDNTLYQMMEDGVPTMADHAVEIIDGERPL
ncbi:Predicted kinase, aminoglycoside phosphotransferase (APT) family [Halorientalis persicus]|uniref:Predicted kinase, aminoglycoside phosphotransferase (APT) family n=1 Tax=Halorientalis persicus TaxID=1367881 RepID=A0A1H8IE36_9EURY|nr:phosphotransferase family protein [Halorientalis persicus]SEN66512.1 Predicted kinase, aminoglycoside phosphotransferase (APT) family [Halorientalis persicus]